MSNILMRISFFSIIFGGAACGSVKNQPQRPMESYQQVVEIPPSVSTVSIPVRLKAAEIERALNNKLNGIIYDDGNLEDDGMMMKATKSQNISIRLEGLQMTYRVPLKLWVFKKIIGSRGIESEGEIALTFKTTLNIKPDWSVEPRTELASYDWLRNMVVKTGLGNIDVKYIANIIIDRSKSTLSNAIDQQMKNQLQIRSNLDEAWRIMQQPVSINSTYGTWWIKLTPQKVSMTPLRSTGNAIESVITAESIVEVIAGNLQPSFRANTNLPSFQINNSVLSNDFNINLTTDISIKEAEQMAKTFVKGQVFNPGGKTIRVEDIQLFGQNDKIVVNTKFSGDYTGSLYLIGRPIFNPLKNTIEMEDLDYDLETKSFLMRSASWLFDRTILKKIKQSCVFPLDENVKYFKTMMNDQLKNYKFNNNVSLNGSVDDIKVDKILLTQGNIKAYIAAKGKLVLDVDGLDTF